LFNWMRQRRNRVTMPAAQVIGRGKPNSAIGVVIGQW
jgi:hypothetical protein